MKKYGLIFSLFLILSLGCEKGLIGPEFQSHFKDAKDQCEEDYDLIEQTANNYILGWYNVDTAQMRSSLHPEMLKRSVRTRANGTQFLRTITTNQLVATTARGIGLTPIDQQYKEVEILDKFRDVSLVRLTSNNFVDNFHIIRVNNEWKIINVLWQLTNYVPSNDNIDAIAIDKVTNYIEGWYEADTAKTLAAIHNGFYRRTMEEVGDETIVMRTKKDEYLEEVRSGGGSNIPEHLQKANIEVLEASLDMINVKLIAYNRIEYIFLSKYNGEWYIISTFWLPVH